MSITIPQLPEATTLNDTDLFFINSVVNVGDFKVQYITIKNDLTISIQPTIDALDTRITTLENTTIPDLQTEIDALEAKYISSQYATITS